VKKYYSLRTNNIGLNGIQALADLIALGALADGSSLDVSHNAFGDEGLSLIIQALKSEKCPNHLKILMTDCNISVRGAEEIFNFFTSGSFDRGTFLYFNKNPFQYDMSPQAVSIKEKLKRAENPLGIYAGELFFDVEWRCPLPKPVQLMPENSRLNAILETQLASQPDTYFRPFSVPYMISNDFLIQLETQSDKDEWCIFSYYLIGDEELIHFAHLIQYLKEPIKAKKLTLAFDNHIISDIGIKALAEALTSPFLPDHTELDLSHNAISKKGGEYLLDIIQSGRCKTILDVNLDSNYLDDTTLLSIKNYLEFYRQLNLIRDNAEELLSPKTMMDSIQSSIASIALLGDDQPVSAEIIHRMWMGRQRQMHLHNNLPLYLALVAVLKQSPAGFDLPPPLFHLICDYLLFYSLEEYVQAHTGLKRFPSLSRNSMFLAQSLSCPKRYKDEEIDADDDAYGHCSVEEHKISL
jgi:hypothetical protein